MKHGSRRESVAEPRLKRTQTQEVAFADIDGRLHFDSRNGSIGSFEQHVDLETIASYFACNKGFESGQKQGFLAR